MKRLISFSVLLGFIIVIGVLFYRVMFHFLLPLFLAAVLVVIFRPVHHWVLDKCKGRQRVAAAATTAVIMLIVLAPACWIFARGVAEGASLAARLDGGTVSRGLSKLRGRLGLDMYFAGDLRNIEASLKKVRDDAVEGAGGAERLFVCQKAVRQVSSLQEKIANSPSSAAKPDIAPLRSAVEQLSQPNMSDAEFDAASQAALQEFHDFRLAMLGGPQMAWLKDLANPTEEELRQMSREALPTVQHRLLSFGGATTALLGKLALGLAIVVIATYFFLRDGPAMIHTFMRLSPLDDRHEQELLDEFGRVSRAIVLAALLSAAAQGFLAGIGYWLAGLDLVFLLVLLTALLAMIPFLGAAAVWAPISLWLYFAEGRPLAAVLLAVYGMGVISLVDNIIKPFVLHGQSGLHPLLALLSVLGGVQALGPIGILVGPMVVVFLQTSLNILHRELTSWESRAAAESVAAS